MNVARDGVHSLAHELAAVLDCDGSRHPKSNHALALNFFIASARASSRSLDCALMAKLRPQSGTRCCPPESQTFLLVGTCILLPFIIGYTVFVYHTFRGKLAAGEGYQQS